MSATNHPADYQTFELLIGAATPTGYPLTVTYSPAGEATAICHLDPADSELCDALTAIADRNTDAAFLAHLGAFLFDELFTGEIGTLYRTSLGIARSQGQRLRVRLRIEPPEVACLPWEYLHDAQEENTFAISPEIALVRYVPMRLPVRPSAVTLPLRLLVVLASPYDLPGLNESEERRLIEEALQERVAKQEVTLQFLEAATIANIQQVLRSFQPHVFHFVGHGVFAENGAQLVLEDEQGNAAPVDERTFRELFAGSRETRLAVLNACQTGSTSNSQPLVGLAPRLLQRQLSAVVAMQYPITDAAGLIFAREFYRSLAVSFPIDAAIDEARRGIWLELGADQPDWGAPVLFLRAADGQLFQVTKSEGGDAAYPLPPEPMPLPHINCCFGREAVLAHYQAQLQHDGLAVIYGMAGVGKTTLAALLARQTVPTKRIFWHTFQEEEGIQTLFWALASFLCWHGQDELWRLLHATQVTALPAELVVDHLLQRVRKQGYLVCLDNLPPVSVDPLFGKLLDRLKQACQRAEVALIVTARHAPDFLDVLESPPLSGLDLTATHQLLDAEALSIDDALYPAQAESIAVILHRQTEGNPQLLLLAINSIRRHPQPAQLLTQLVQTDDIERYLLRTVDEELTEEERTILSAVATLLGYTGSEDVIETLVTRSNLRRQLRDLCDRFLLMTSYGKHMREYGEHAMIQAFYYGLLNRHQRQTFHKLAAEYYTVSEPDLVKVALHYERSAEAAKAVYYLTLVGDQAKQISAHRSALDFYQRALKVITTLPPNESSDMAKQQVALLAKAGQMHEYLGEQAAAQRCNEEGLHLAQVNGEQLHAAECLNNLGAIAVSKGDFAKAMELYQAALQQFVELGVRQGEASVLCGLGNLAFFQADYEKSRAAFEQALAINQELADHYQEIAVLNGLALVATYQGDYAAAQQQYQYSLDLSRRLDYRLGVATVLCNLAHIYNLQGDAAKVQAAYREAVAISRAIGFRFAEAGALIGLALLAEQQGDYAMMEKLGQEALMASRAIDHHFVEAAALLVLGYVAVRQGERLNAKQAFMRALEIGDEMALDTLLLSGVVGIAHLQSQIGALDKAATLLILALEHPALEHEDRRRAERLMASIKPQLHEASLAQKESRNLTQVVAEILQEKGSYL